MAKGRTKFIRFLLKKIGYDLRRLEKFHIHEEDPGTSLGQGGGFDAFDAIIRRPVKSFDIIFRSCSGVEIFAQNKKRITGAAKSEVIVRCLNSLVSSINNALAEGLDGPISLTVMDDHSSPDCIKKMSLLLDKAMCKSEFIPLDVTGNGPSFGAVLRHAKLNFRDLIYFVEDDYLHENIAITEIIKSYERLAFIAKSDDIVLSPDDCPDRYRHLDPTHVVLGGRRHWRTVPSTTFTCVTTRKLLEKYWANYIATENYGIDPKITEANTINLIYKDIPCFSPLPGLAVHFQQYDGISPYVDWNEWWDRAKV